MAENASLRIHSYQMIDGEATEPFLIKTRGRYGFGKGIRFIVYTEAYEDGGYITNRIKITGSHVEITRKGAVNAEITFGLEEEGRCLYQTPYGLIDLLVFFKGLSVHDEGDRIIIEMAYELNDGSAVVSINHLKLIAIPDNKEE